MDMQRLYELKFVKLREQAMLSQEMKTVCFNLNESNRRVRKNLEVAIAVSKCPGHFQYYEPEISIKQVFKG